MKKLIAGVFFLFISFAATAQEGPRTYWTLGGGLLTLDDGFDTIDPVQVFGRLGYDFNANFGIGVEGGFSLIEDSVGIVDVSVTTLFLYLKGSIPIGNGAKLYAMIGPSNVDITGTVGGFSASADDSDTGLGFGFEKSLDTFSISVDYITYFDDFGVDISAFNVGFVGYF